MQQEKAEIPYLISAPSDIAWSAACAAQRINGDYRPVVNTGSNKDVMLNILRHEPELIQEQDVQQAFQAREWFQGQIFSLLGGALNEYMQRAAEVAIKEEINIRTDAGILASLPNTWLRSMRKQNIQDIIVESASVHVGAVTEKIVRMIEVLDSKQGVSFTGWLVTATDGTNIYRFCTSVQFNDGEAVRIQGKIKRHDFDKETKKPVTWLNYVKKFQ